MNPTILNRMDKIKFGNKTYLFFASNIKLKKVFQIM